MAAAAPAAAALCLPARVAETLFASHLVSSSAAANLSLHHHIPYCVRRFLAAWPLQGWPLREFDREGGKEGGNEGGREGGKEGGREAEAQLLLLLCYCRLGRALGLFEE